MNTPDSLRKLGEWLREFRSLDADANTTDIDVSDHLDKLAEVITSMSMDFELAGLDCSEIKALSMKQRLLQRRPIPKRFEIVDELMILSARLLRSIETEAKETIELGPLMNDQQIKSRFACHIETIGTWRRVHGFPRPPVYERQIDQWVEQKLLDSDCKLRLGNWKITG